MSQGNVETVREVTAAARGPEMIALLAGTPSARICPISTVHVHERPQRTDLAVRAAQVPGGGRRIG